MYCSIHLSAADKTCIAIICDAPPSDFVSYSGKQTVHSVVARFLSVRCLCRLRCERVIIVRAWTVDAAAEKHRRILRTRAGIEHRAFAEFLEHQRRLADKGQAGRVPRSALQLCLRTTHYNRDCGQVKYCRTVARNSDGAPFFEISVESCVLPCAHNAVFQLLVCRQVDHFHFWAWGSAFVLEPVPNREAIRPE